MEPETVPPELRRLGPPLLAVTTRQERSIDGLLMLARSERDILKRTYVDPEDVVEHVVAQLPAGPVTLRTDLAEGPTTGDPVLLERLAQNLVDNGVKHNVAADGWVRVTTGSGPDDSVVLQVGNTGPVMPRYEVPGLLEPFRQLDGERLATRGAGLGRSIVRAVARAHGGDVHAEPRAGGGLVVTVTLPAAT